MRTLELYIYTFFLFIFNDSSYGAVDCQNPNILCAAATDVAPYEYSTKNGPRGLAIDLINEVLTRSNNKIKVEYSFYPWSRAVQRVRLGKEDLLFNSGKNSERLKWGDYVNVPLIIENYVFFRKKGNKINIFPDYSNVSDFYIGIRRGYIYGNGQFRNALNRKKFKRVFEVDSTQQNVQMLLFDRLDFFVGDLIPVMKFLRENNLEDKVDIITNAKTTKNFEVLTWPTYLLFSKKTTSHSFVKQVEENLKIMKLDGTYDRIYNNYMKRYLRKSE